MSYYQLTIDDWLRMKQRLQAELLGVRKSFVRIGYILRKIEESKGYENDGYKTISEWAKGECNLEGSTVSRLIAINKEYSVDGYSEVLLPDFEDFKKSQLEEMLKLPMVDREMIRPETPRADIRELKQFNKQEPVEGVADDTHQLIENFFVDNEEILREVYGNLGNMDAMKDAVNPSGNRSYRKGIFFMMMYEDSVKIKKYAGKPESITWSRFFEVMKEVFGEELTIAPAQNPHETKEEEVIESADNVPETDDIEEKQEIETIPVPEETDITDDVCESEEEKEDPVEEEDVQDDRIEADVPDGIAEEDDGGTTDGTDEDSDPGHDDGDRGETGESEEIPKRSQFRTRVNTALSNLHITIGNKAWAAAIEDCKHLLHYLQIVEEEER